MGESEAQRIVDELLTSLGMQGAAIAREIGVKADTITNIRRRHSSGNLYTPRLRILRDQMASAAGHRPTLPRTDVPTQTVIDQLPSVDDMLSSVKEAPEPAGIDLNAEEPSPAPKRGFFDGLRAAMLGDSSQPSMPSMAAPSRRKNEKGDDPKEDFVAKMTPIAALLLVMAVRSRIHDPYKPLAPQPHEMRDIIEPWMTWMAKQLDIRGRLTEDANFALASLLATGLYGVRAYETYQAIHAEEAQRVRSERQPSGAGYGADFLAASGGRGLGGNTTMAAADAGAGHGVSGASAPFPFWRGNAGRTHETTRAAGGELHREPASPEQRRADASIDALLAADHAGRLRLGL